MLEINDLRVSVEGKQILKGLNLSVPAGEVHAIMGPNGAGKSTLAYALAGREGYDLEGGSAKLLGNSIIGLDPEDRAALGLFLAFQ
jgi:Fe-S cluster assembly ATP-binding protein